MSHQDQGNGTVLSLAMMGAVAAAGILVAAQVQIVMATHALQGAADLAAIAAAQSPDDSCGAAIAVAQANQVRLVNCRPEDSDFIVQVETDLPSLIAAVLSFAHVEQGPIHANARAGPEVTLS